jgi:ParB family transcriptional regulator, chromosome partitioning protein
MTSGVFHSCAIDQISKGERQRQDFSRIDELADSIKRLGLIHPIVVTRDYILVAGERRLMACKSLGWESITFQFVDETDPQILQAIELEENIKRQDLTWQERTNAIAAYHKLRTVTESEWSNSKTGRALGLDRSTIEDHLQVAAHMDNPTIREAPHFSIARGIVQRKEERAIESEILPGPNPAHIQHCSFLDWIKTYEGPKFNLIHCDFPYGLGFDKMGSQAGSTLGRYKDSFELYKELISTLCLTIDTFAEESCHLVFWFSMQSYQFTFERLANYGGVFEIDPFPLVWVKSDNSGILPDPARGPRRIYETAFLGRRGDRRIVRAKSNAFSSPSTNIIHPHEKSQEMLEHFFEMLVDENTSILDPTCGGGSALRAAKKLGARHILGLEINGDYARQANIELAKLDGGGFV